MGSSTTSVYGDKSGGNGLTSRLLGPFSTYVGLFRQLSAIECDCTLNFANGTMFLLRSQVKLRDSARAQENSADTLKSRMKRVSYLRRPASACTFEGVEMTFKSPTLARR